MYYYLLQLGCQMNIADGERIRAVLSEIGFRRSDNEAEAQLLGIVACSVRQKAIDKVYSKIHQWNEWKKTKQLLTFASGCILPADRERLLKQFDFVFPIQELGRLPEFITQYGVPLPQSYQIPTIVSVPAERGDGGAAPGAAAADGEAASDTRAASKTEAASKTGAASKTTAAAVRTGGASGRARRMATAEYLNVTPQYGSQFEAYVPIQNGCDKFCTFCAVPYTRGREVSRPSEEIMAEVRGLLAAGYRTITLLGQNVNSYGLDRRGTEEPFPRLLERIATCVEESGTRRWVYFTSPHPRDFNEEVFEVMARHPSIAKQVHLPLQSGDDKVLMRMNRKHSAAHYRRLVEMIRRQLPTATLFTDIIVGFCGETEEQFESTRRAMREFQYNMAYIAQYSPRPGAASSRWADDVDAEVKKRRYRELTLELHRSAFAYNSALIGRTVEALVLGRDRKEGYLAARTEGRVNARFASDNEELVGQIVSMEVQGANGLSLEGRVRQREEAAATVFESARLA